MPGIRLGIDDGVSDMVLFEKVSVADGTHVQDPKEYGALWEQEAERKVRKRERAELGNQGKVFEKAQFVSNSANFLLVPPTAILFLEPTYIPPAK